MLLISSGWFVLETQFIVNCLGHLVRGHKRIRRSLALVPRALTIEDRRLPLVKTCERLGFLEVSLGTDRSLIVISGRLLLVILII
jgi:hypothetical protein